MMRVPPAAVRTIAIAAVAVAVVLAARHPLEATMPIYGELAEKLRIGSVTSSFEPLGYAWLISKTPGGSLEASVKTLHLVCFAALAALVLVLSRRIGQPISPWLALAFTWMLFNPYVLVNVYRLNDNSLNVVAVLAAFALIWLPGESVRYVEWAMAGVLVGVLAHVRPNVLSLLPAIWIAAWAPVKLQRPLWHGGTATVAMLMAYAGCSLLITGGPFFRPGNGPYNLFAGNNPSSARVLLADYNAEASLPEGVQWCGVDGALRTIPGDTYLRCATRFVTESPLAAIKVTALKWYTLMWRPNLRLADTPFEVAAQIAQLLPSWLWWGATAAALVRRRRLFDPIATVFVVMFAVPFVLTNADPRFRLPLDAVYALSVASPASIRVLRRAGSEPIPAPAP